MAADDDGPGYDAPAIDRERFEAAGYSRHDFFPHRWHVLPKSGPDGARLARWMCGSVDPHEWSQLLLFATSPAIDQFPAELFADPDVLWHEQHLGQLGQVASVNLVSKGRRLYTMLHQSDLVQRISRRRDVRVRVRRVFKGWHHLLFNAIGDYAIRRGIDEVRVPTSRLAMRHTDPARTVKPELFERVYDRAVLAHCSPIEVAGWWSIRTEDIVDQIVRPNSWVEQRTFGKTVCICHDTERGIGHRDVDPEFARRADIESDLALDEMLRIESRLNVRATYDVVGRLMPEVRRRIEAHGHRLAFHSYDHVKGRDQLDACREVDYRIKGYRPPQSRMTRELTSDRLLWHNFEWLASSTFSLDLKSPTLADRLAQIPIHFDDYPMHAEGVDFETWRQRVFDAVRNSDFIAVGLHDCYARHWLPHYEKFLTDLKGVARLTTVDQVASELYLAGGQ